MSDLAEFLLARIAEDEAFASDAAHFGQHWEQDPMKHSEWVISEKSGITIAERGPREHIAHFDPHRVLAECQAKRRILDYCGASNLDEDDEWWFAMQCLAIPYAEHEDFDPAWRVESEHDQSRHGG